MQKFYKDSDAVLDYTVDWTEWLAASETISTSVWTVQTGLTVDSSSNTSFVGTVWLSGGVVGTTYTAANKITTNQGRTDERTLEIRVTNR